MASSSSAKRVAKLASRGKGKKVRFQGGSIFPVVIVIVVIIGLVGILYARSSRPTDGAGPPRLGDHWHAAYGVYVCQGKADNVVTTTNPPATTTPGATTTTAAGGTTTVAPSTTAAPTTTAAPSTTVAPSTTAPPPTTAGPTTTVAGATTTTPSGTTTTTITPIQPPLAAAGFEWLPHLQGTKEATTVDPVTGSETLIDKHFRETGIHSHGDGVIHYHPYTGRATGTRARLGVFLDAYNVTLTDTKLQLPKDQGGDVYDVKHYKCDNGKTPVVTVRVWDSYADPSKYQDYVTDFKNIRITKNGMVFVVAVVPKGTDIPMPTWAQELPSLGAADGGSTISVPGTGGPTGSTPTTGGSSTTGGASTTVATTTATTTPSTPTT